MTDQTPVDASASNNTPYSYYLCFVIAGGINMIAKVSAEYLNPVVDESSGEVIGVSPNVLSFPVREAVQLMPVSVPGGRVEIQMKALIGDSLFFCDYPVLIVPSVMYSLAHLVFFKNKVYDVSLLERYVQMHNDVCTKIKAAQSGIVMPPKGIDFSGGGNTPFGRGGRA